MDLLSSSLSVSTTNGGGSSRVSSALRLWKACLAEGGPNNIGGPCGIGLTWVLAAVCEFQMPSGLGGVG